jgi:hypothetical protein
MERLMATTQEHGRLRFRLTLLAHRIRLMWYR